MVGTSEERVALQTSSSEPTAAEVIVEPDATSFIQITKAFFFSPQVFRRNFNVLIPVPHYVSSKLGLKGFLFFFLVFFFASFFIE